MGLGGRWTEEDDARLREIASRGSRADAVRELGRTVLAVKRRAGRLRIRFAARGLGGKHVGKQAKNWTPAEDRALACLVQDLPYTKIARELGRTREAIACRVLQLGLRPREHKYSMLEVAEFLGISDATVANYRTRLGQKWGMRHGQWPGLDSLDVAELAQAILDQGNTRVTVPASHLRRIAEGELTP